MRVRNRTAEALALLGLAQRARATVWGSDGIRRALRNGEVKLLVLAKDGSEGQREKLVPLARAREVPRRFLGTKEDLGNAVGSGPLTALAVTRQGFAEELLERLGREEGVVAGKPSGGDANACG